MGINPEIMQQIRQELSTAPHGHKSITMRRWAVVVGISQQSLYRELDLGVRTREGTARRPELRDWAMTVAEIKKRPPEEAGEISTDQAMKIAVDSSNAPAELLDVHPATIDRVMRDLGTTKTSVRCVRFQAKDPNQAHHFDASTSAFFYVAKKTTDGEYILKMHRPSKHYKNKPVPVDQLRPWYYGLCDDHSGRKIARLIVGQGENAADSLLSINEFWNIFGVPKKLLADQGMLKKCLASAGYIHACGVELPQMMPYAKRGHGKIENPWKTQWQRFEKPFYAVDDWQKFEITDAEMNKRLDAYMEEENARPHRFERTITRMDAWRRVMLCGGIVKLPEDALSRAHTMDKRKVGIDGLVHLDNVSYEVKGDLCDAWVYVYRSMFENKMVAEDVETGERYEIKNFKPLDEGEYKNFNDTPHEIAVKNSAALNIPKSALPFQQDSKFKIQNSNSNVVRMPIRETVREVEDVFNTDHYATIEDAMNEFDGIFLPSEDQAAIAEIIRENGMDKAFVRNLAQEIRGEIEVRKANAI